MNFFWERENDKGRVNFCGDDVEKKVTIIAAMTSHMNAHKHIFEIISQWQNRFFLLSLCEYFAISLANKHFLYVFASKIL